MYYLNIVNNLIIVCHMSFEDDMIEEGFSNEQDYLDHICNKADSRSHFEDEEEMEDQRNRERKEYESRVRYNRKLHHWKELQNESVRLWGIIWAFNKKNNLYLRNDDLVSDEGIWWVLWKRSADTFARWKENNKELIEKVFKERIITTFEEYCQNNEIKDVHSLYHRFIESNNTGNRAYPKSINSAFSLDAFIQSIQRGDMKCIQFLYREDTPIRRILKQNTDNAYFSWLSSRFSLSEMIESGVLDTHHPLYTAFGDKQYRDILNKNIKADCWPKWEAPKGVCPIVYGIDNTFSYYDDLLCYHEYVHELIEELYPDEDSM